MAGVVLFLVLYWLAPVGTPYWLLMTYLFFIGAFIYCPVMLIGLQALDMSAKNVAGTSARFTGLFGYVLGTTMASTAAGWVIQHYGWNVAYAMLTVFVLLSIGPLLLVVPHEKRLVAHHRSISGSGEES